MKLFFLILYINLILFSCIWINFGKSFGNIQYNTTCLLNLEWPKNINSEMFFKYNKNNSLILLKCCVLSSIIYSNHVNFKKCDFFERVYTIESYSFSRQMHKFGFLAICKNFMILSIKSTSNLDDIFVSSDTNFVDIDDGEIHRGYYTQSIELLPNIYEKLIKHKEIKDIFICGHSLGGTLSTVIGYLLAKFLPNYRICVYNYASIKFGNKLLKYNIEKMKNFKIFNIINKSDLVVHKPSFSEFKRIGYVIEYKIDTGSHNSNHSIRTYRNCICDFKNFKNFNKKDINQNIFRFVLDLI